MRNFVKISFFMVLLYSQDELLELINDDSKINPTPVQATFKATRIVNSQSIEMPRAGTLEFMILHRFGSMSNGFYDLFGMDEAVIRFDLKYGTGSNFSFGLGRSSLKKTYDIFSKFSILKQKVESGHSPISLVIFSKVEIETQTKDAEFINRLTYDFQLLIARKFTRFFSFQIMPTLIHKNLVESQNNLHDLFSIGTGARMKLSKRISINFDTFIPIGERKATYQQGWGIGCDIETGGHVFQLMITNSQGAIESAYIENATGGFDNLNLYLGFNITRAFSI
tara:strand:- start:2559 stop:3401 length:843 start_codon:yes stop_codon:yes gene_type:complete